jgi:D-lactate dehydrogenase
MKVSFLGIKNWEIDYIKQNFKAVQDIKFCFEEGVDPLDSSVLQNIRDSEIVSVFVDSSISKKVIDEMKDLKFVTTRSTGFDHIDLNACRERGIRVSYVPSYGENTVAEFAFALLLSLSRKIYEAYDQIRETGNWSFDSLEGFDLKGKTVGVIGTGRIGRYFIKMAKGFDMKILAYDTFPNYGLSSELGFEYTSLEDLLSGSDIVSLHVPYGPQTHHLINSDRIKLMKKGAILINTSRGAIVDTEALVFALKSKHLGGAGIDVFEEEGVIKDEISFLEKGNPREHDLKKIIANHVLIDMPNVILTPHNAFNTREAKQRILDTTIANIEGYIKGEIINEIK